MLKIKQKHITIIKQIILEYLPLLLMLMMYYLIIARHYFSGQYLPSGDTYKHWALNFIAFYSLHNFNELPWWDPTTLNGYPIYYQLISGWACFLNPVYLFSIFLFKILNLFFDVNINQYIFFHITMIVNSILLILIYLCSKEMIRNKIIVYFPAFLFIFSYFQLLNMHDYYCIDNMIMPLFYLYTLIKYSKNRNITNLLCLFIALLLLISSFNMVVATTSWYWTTIVSILIVIFNKKILIDTIFIIRNLSKTKNGCIGIASAFIMFLLSLITTYSAVYFNKGNYIRYRGGIVTNNIESPFANSSIPIEYNEIWSQLFNWIPFSDVRDNIIQYSWHGHDYRYIGIFTLILTFLGIFVCIRNRLAMTLLFTYVICNIFLLYTERNLFYQYFIDSFAVIKNIRNMSTLYARGGASILLIFFMAIVFDKISRIKRIKEIKYIRFSNFILNCLIVAGSFIIFQVFNEGSKVRHSFMHIGFYLIFFSILTKALITHKNKKTKQKIILLLFLLTFIDLTISTSYQVKRVDQSNRNISYVLYDYNAAIAIPDDTKLKPVNPGDALMFPERYVGSFHHSGIPDIGKKDWLILLTNSCGQQLLQNWDIKRNQMISYPAFKFFTNGYYKSFNDLDNINYISVCNSITNSYPKFFLHDQNLVSSINKAPRPLDIKYRINNFTFTEVEIELDSVEDGFVMFLDNNDRFWNAYVNEKETEIYTANYTYKAVKFFSGKNIIRWKYDPYIVKYLFLLHYLAIILMIIFFKYKLKPNRAHIA
ncbi:MAG: hypothetical protein HQK49_13990 [Oligoflexia bacterium]|nr:hypothetical protein [Oligoflexia bacterium]